MGVLAPVSAAATLPVSARPASHHQQPSAKTIGLAELPQAPERTQEDIVDQIISHIEVSGHVVADGLKQAHVSVVQIAKGGVVTGENGPDKAGVVPGLV